MKVWAGIKSNTTVTTCTLNDLRKETYTNSSTTKGIDALPLQVQLCVFLCQNVYNLVEENRNKSLNPLGYGCEEHSKVLFPSKCIMRCHQTFSDCVSVLASVTNDVVVRVLNCIVYYFVTRVGIHVSHNSKTEGIIS